MWLTVMRHTTQTGLRGFMCDPAADGYAAHPAHRIKELYLGSFTSS